MSKSIQAVVSVDKDHRLWIIGYYIHGLTTEVAFSYASFCNVRYDSLEVALSELFDKIYADRKICSTMDEIVYRSKDQRIISLIHKLMIHDSRYYRLYHLNRGFGFVQSFSIWIRSKILESFKRIYTDHPYAVAIGWCPIGHLVNDEHRLIGMKLKETGIPFREKSS